MSFPSICQAHSRESLIWWFLLFQKKRERESKGKVFGINSNPFAHTCFCFKLIPLRDCLCLTLAQTPSAQPNRTIKAESVLIFVFISECFYGRKTVVLGGFSYIAFTTCNTVYYILQPVLFVVYTSIFLEISSIQAENNMDFKMEIIYIPFIFLKKYFTFHHVCNFYDFLSSMEHKRRGFAVFTALDWITCLTSIRINLF